MLLGPVSGHGLEVKVQEASYVDFYAITKRGFHYWEFLVYVVKVLLTVAMAGVSNERRELPLMFAFMILIAYAGMTVVSEPYQSSFLNKFNMASIITVLLLACFKLLLITASEGPDYSTSNPKELIGILS